MGSLKKTPALALFLCLNLMLFTYTSTAAVPDGGEKGKAEGVGGEKEEGGEGKGEAGGGEGGKGECKKRDCSRQEGEGGKGQGKGHQQGGEKGGAQCPTCSGGGGKVGGGDEKCPVNALKLGVCADVLRSLLKIKVGEPPVKPCCSLIKDLADVEAALCLCTAIKTVSVLGITLDIPLSLSLMLNTCGKKAPTGFQCPKTTA